MATTPIPVLSSEKSNAPFPISIIETIRDLERRVRVLEKALSQNEDAG